MSTAVEEETETFTEEFPVAFHEASADEIKIIEDGIEKARDRHDLDPDIGMADFDNLEVAYSKQGNFTNAIVLDLTNNTLYTGTAKRHPDEDPFIAKRGKHIALTHLAMQGQAIAR